MPAVDSKFETPFVVGAMVLIAIALGLGLVVKAGVDPVLSALVAVAALLVMLSAHLAVRRTRAYALASDEVAGIAKRLSALEERFQTLNENLAQSHSLPGHLVDLDGRLSGLRAEFEQESRLQRERVSSELQVIEALVKQLAEEIAVATAMQTVQSARHADFAQAPASGEQEAAPPGSAMRKAEPPQIAAPVQEHQAFEATDNMDRPTVSGPAPDTFVPEPDSTLTAPTLQTGMASETGDLFQTIRESIEANRIDLYLQPIVSLPDRKVLYYEALTRLRDEQGGAILPADYIEIAEPAGLMPLIDNMLLFRAVQVMRRFAERNRARSLFCNFSILSLLDSEFFPEFMNFLEQHKELTSSLFFEFGQPVVEELGPIELESLNALGELGFRFSLDKVEDLDLDFQALYQHHFRYLKVDADIFLNGMAEAGAQIHAADMRDYLHRFGLDLIVEKVETETTATALAEHDVRLAQGYLFSEPKPVRAEIFDHEAEGEAA